MYKCQRLIVQAVVDEYDDEGNLVRELFCNREVIPRTKWKTLTDDIDKMVSVIQEKGPDGVSN